jgi:hypothetical protein
VRHPSQKCEELVGLTEDIKRDVTQHLDHLLDHVAKGKLNDSAVYTLVKAYAQYICGVQGSWLDWRCIMPDWFKANGYPLE